MLTKRILVTGSRDWVDRQRINDALFDEIRTFTPNPCVLVHGGCPSGADHIAHTLWVTNMPGRPIEVYRADWDTHGKKAGFLRNQHMVDLGADVCLAFIKDGSAGASMTANLAEEAGIVTKRFIGRRR